MTKIVNIEKEEKKSKSSKKDPIDWEKLAQKIGIVISFITIIGFLITLAFNIINLGEKVGELKGQMQYLREDFNNTKNTPTPIYIIITPSLVPSFLPNP